MTLYRLLGYHLVTSIYLEGCSNQVLVFNKWFHCIPSFVGFDVMLSGFHCIQTIQPYITPFVDFLGLFISFQGSLIDVGCIVPRQKERQIPFYSICLSFIVSDCLWIFQVPSQDSFFQWSLMDWPSAGSSSSISCGMYLLNTSSNSSRR